MIDHWLDALHLVDLEARHPRSLSGGERQRVAIAAVAVGGAPVLLLDEPTRGMDASSRHALERAVRDARGRPEARSCSQPTTSSCRHGARRARSCSGDGDVVADGDARHVLAGSLFAPQVLRVLPPYLTVEEVEAELARPRTRDERRRGVATGDPARVRPVVVYVLMLVIGAAAFLYPFWLPATALTDQAHNGDAPLIAALVGALVVAAVLLEVRRGTMNGATVALLGVLAGVGRAAAAHRPARRRQRHLLPRRARGRRVRPSVRPPARALLHGACRPS